VRCVRTPSGRRLLAASDVERLQHEREENPRTPVGAKKAARTD